MQSTPLKSVSTVLIIRILHMVIIIVIIDIIITVTLNRLGVHAVFVADITY